MSLYFVCLQFIAAPSVPLCLSLRVGKCDFTLRFAAFITAKEHKNRNNSKLKRYK